MIPFLSLRLGRLVRRWWPGCLLMAGLRLACAQSAPGTADILERLDRLERQNAALTAQVKSLEAEVTALRSAQGTAAAPPAVATIAPATPETPHVPTPEERLDVVEQRVEEQAQTKVEASQKFPIRLTGMALFNAYANSRGAGGSEYPTIAAAPAAGFDGATLRQTIVGLDFRGPKTFGNGQIQGDVQMDFFTSNNTLAESLRIRTGYIEIDWADTNLMVGLEKPIFNPREPASLAQVGLSPLTGAGNLWLWIPQVRLEHDLAFGSSAGVRAQMGVVETKESSPYAGSTVTGPVAPDRPGLEGRFEFFYKLDNNRRLEIAPGFHFSTTHAAGFSIPSQVFAADMFFNPWPLIELTGVAFTGHNLTNLGTGGVNEGYALMGRNAIGIAATGGWGQITLHALRRADLHLFVGRQSYSSSVLDGNDVATNFQFGANVFFRIAPNVLIGPEISQMRTTLYSWLIRINNHYDLALAYLF